MNTFADVLRSELDAVGKTIEVVAGDLKVSAAAVAAWRSGQKRPGKNNLAKLIQYIAEQTSRDPAQIRKRFEKSTQRDAHVSAAVLAPGGLLRVGWSHHPDTPFLDKLFERFVAFIDRQAEKVPRTGRSIELQRQLLKGEVDVGLALYATAARAFDLRFIEAPVVRIGMNAVCLQSSRKTPEDLQQMARHLTLGGNPRADLLPIVDPTDVGGHYVLHTLRLIPGSEALLEDNYDVTAFAKRLCEEDKRATARTPVLVADETFCLFVLRQLRTMPNGESGMLVFPLSTQATTQKEKRDLPVFLPAISLARKRKELFDILHYGMKLFLQTEPETVSDFLNETRVNLEQLAMEYLPRSSQPQIEPWGDFMFRFSDLDAYQDLDLPWARILQRARQKSKRDIAMRLREIVSGILVDDHLPEAAESTKTEILAALCKEFEVELEARALPTWNLKQLELLVTRSQKRRAGNPSKVLNLEPLL